VVSIDQSGVATFRVFLPDAQRVQLVGDFTRWQEAAIEMLREPCGWWRAQASPAAGEYEFQYLVDNETWLPDYAAHGLVRGPFGGWQSRLQVPEIAGDMLTEREHPAKKAA